MRVSTVTIVSYNKLKFITYHKAVKYKGKIIHVIYLA